ncbi:MAG: 50S ribosomal protein L18 [marine bacterium B5-7]|nr:MAG: 50S ribosomal protein L18 [marine bacterium B5-7]
MISSKIRRARRALKTRSNLRRQRNGFPRLTVHRTGQHIYAQLITPADAKGLTTTLASASTLMPELRKTYGGNMAAAAAVGKHVAEQAKAQGISQVAFDRSGFKYHGRVKALADAARESGLEF